MPLLSFVSSFGILFGKKVAVPLDSLVNLNVTGEWCSSFEKGGIFMTVGDLIFVSDNLIVGNC